MGDAKRKFIRKVRLSVVILFAVMAAIGLFAVTDTFAQETEAAAGTVETEIGENRAEVFKFGLIAAALAFGFGAIGAGMAISHVGAAAMGAIGEKPEIAPQALIFIALAEGLVVFGFIAALMILGKF